MILSKEKLQSLAHIPTEEVRQDLINAKRELNVYVTELKAIEEVGIQSSNKVRHYMLEAKCSKGKEFIDELYQILNDRALDMYRNINPPSENPK